MESTSTEEATVQVTVSFDTPVKEEKSKAQSDSPSVKGGYNLRCQPRSVARLVDQPARLSMRARMEKSMKASKAGEGTKRIVRKKFAANITDDDRQSIGSRSKAGEGKRKRRAKRGGARSKLQRNTDEKNKRQRKRPGPKKMGRPSGAPRGRPRTRDPYKFNDNASVHTVGRLMHVHPPKRVSGCGLQDDIQCIRSVVGEQNIDNREQTVEVSHEMPQDTSASVHERPEDEQIRNG
ncbi:hypothetical protein D918_04257 [Trichuris suis]|nr:hypothetical protein D918_04257 [Trichuris suis]